MLSKIFALVLFSATLISIVFFARGYRINIQDAQINSQGLVAMTSSPKGASIFVNGVLTDVTDTSLYLDPGSYVIKVQKEGYFPWSKTVQIEGEIVQSLDAVLYPMNASLAPLTNIGIVRAIPFGIGAKKILLFSSQQDTNDDTSLALEQSLPNPTETRETTDENGIFVFDTRTQAITLFPSLNQVVAYSQLTSDINLDSTLVYFSPDFEQIVLITGADANNTLRLESERTGRFGSTYLVPETFQTAYLINLETQNASPLDITSSVSNLFEIWAQQKAKSVTALLSGYDAELKSFLQENTSIVDMSLDKTRILYESTASAILEPVLKTPLLGSNQTPEMRSLEPQNIYVYDTKEDKNYKIMKDETRLEDFSYPFFHPNSKNIIHSVDGAIIVMDYDGLNGQKIYTGPRKKDFITMAPDGRIIILTNFSSALDSTYDLYALGIR